MALYSGAGAAAAVLVALPLLARAEGESSIRPLNATSRILRGPKEAPRGGVDMRRTAPGLLINVGAAFFWGGVFALVAPRRLRAPPGALLRRAMLTTAAAAAIDYGPVPRRLRPGWELVLKARSVMAAYVAMGGGLAAGGGFARSVAASQEAAETGPQIAAPGIGDRSDKEGNP